MVQVLSLVKELPYALGVEKGEEKKKEEIGSEIQKNDMN